MTIDQTGTSSGATTSDIETALAETNLMDRRLGVLERIRGGDLGLTPVIIGLIIISIVFQIQNPVFLSSRNLSNLIIETVPVGIIALGIVLSLLTAQIDLSVGSISGLSAAILAQLFIQQDLPIFVAVVGALLAGASIGWLYAQLFNRVGIPSFVITLGGLLAFLGVQLKVLGKAGSINLPFDSFIVEFAQTRFVPEPVAYVLAVLIGAWLFAIGYSSLRERKVAGLNGASPTFIAIRSVVVTIVGLGVVWYLYQDRGIGWMFVLFVVLTMVMQYALTKTKWGKSVYAIGGNVDAARRAGINVNRVYTSVFMLCCTFAALGGVLGAARLAAANQSSGGGSVNLNAIAAAVIGGTSLFGGRGGAWSALLGIFVIQAISNGLTLLNLETAFRFIVTGIVLLIAVGLDSLARRSRETHGVA